MYPYPNNNMMFPSYNPTPNIPEIQYVNSAESADAFNLPPNKTVVLFNQNTDEFYIVSADASGTKTRNDFTFKAKARITQADYVTRDEFNALNDRIEEFINNNTKTPRKATQKATEVEE